MRKRDRILILSESLILSFLLGMASLSCLVTGVRFSSVSLGVLGMVCGAVAIFASVCFSWKYTRLLIVALLVVGIGYLWRSQLFIHGLEAVAYRLSSLYNAAYGWRILLWHDPEELEVLLPAFIYLLGGGITLITAWIVVRGHSSILALIPAVLPIMCCFVVTDTLPKLLWLLLFFAVTALLMITSTTRQEDVNHGAYLTAMIIIPVFAAVTALFYCIPQNGYNLQQLAQTITNLFFRETVIQETWEDVTGQSAVVGSSVDGSRVDLTRVGYRQISRSEIMRVNSRYNGIMYLRGRALDGYTGLEWYDTETDPELPWPSADQLESVGEVVITTRYAHRMMYLPYYATSIDLDLVARGVENTKKLAMYSFSCSTGPGKEQLSQLYPTGDTSPEVYVEDPDYTTVLTELPAHTLAWAVPLVEEIAGQYESPYHKAEAIAEYVRDSAKYNLQTRRMSSNSQDFAQWFLTSSDKGYCVHFATAATVLLKAAGIPARYVTGYLLEVAEGQTTVVLAENAHAWTEYWLPGFGWVMLEVTPPDLPEEPTVGTGTGQQSTTPTETAEPLPTETLPLPEEPEQPEPEQEMDWLPVLLWAGLAMMAVGATLAQWKIRLLLRQRRWSSGDNNSRAIAYWKEGERLDRHLRQTPPEELLVLAEKARFSQHTLTEEELGQFEMHLDGARQQLRSRNIFRRIYHTLILALY